MSRAVVPCPQTPWQGSSLWKERGLEGSAILHHWDTWSIVGHVTELFWKATELPSLSSNNLGAFFKIKNIKTALLEYVKRLEILDSLIVLAGVVRKGGLSPSTPLPQDHPKNPHISSTVLQIFNSPGRKTSMLNTATSSCMPLGLRTNVGFAGVLLSGRGTLVLTPQGRWSRRPHMRMLAGFSSNGHYN